MTIELPKNLEDFSSFRHIATLAHSLYEIHLRINKKELGRLMDITCEHYEKLGIDYDYKENHKDDFYGMRIIVDNSVPDGIAYMVLNSMIDASIPEQQG